MAGIIGKKLEMTRVLHDGAFTPVTLIRVPTLTVAQVKTEEKSNEITAIPELLDLDNLPNKSKI